MAGDSHMAPGTDAGREGVDAGLLGWGRSGTNSLRAYFAQHSGISWRRGLRALLIGDGGGYWQQPTGFSTEAACRIDVFEWYVLGLFRYELSNRDWRQLRYRTPGPLPPAGYRVDVGEAADRLRAALPGARIVLLVREQAAWLQANYRAHVLNLKPGRSSFSDYLATTEGTIAAATAHYDVAVRIYQERFGSANVLVLASEMLRCDPSRALGALCRFLGVAYEPPAVELRRNASAPPGLVRLHTRLARLPGERCLARLISAHVRRHWGGWPRLPGGARVPRHEAVVRDDEYQALRQRYVQTNRRLADITGLDLPGLGYAVAGH